MIVWLVRLSLTGVLLLIIASYYHWSLVLCLVLVTISIEVLTSVNTRLRNDIDRLKKEELAKLTLIWKIGSELSSMKKRLHKQTPQGRNNR